jgi:hypothetical protein
MGRRAVVDDLTGQRWRPPLPLLHHHQDDEHCCDWAVSVEARRKEGREEGDVHIYIKQTRVTALHDQLWQVWKNQNIRFCISEHPVFVISEQEQGRSQA